MLLDRITPILGLHFITAQHSSLKPKKGSINTNISSITQGVPVRVELGPKDMARGEVVAVRRLTGEKITFKRAEAGKQLVDLLEKTHKEMFDK